ncbi:MAG TPA: Rrf2 family transcriptional regulator [Gammaproteobacteria bacterium]|nr:Rrf2 family transcriptional regulator [Gammaproteobacteria bacterium]
MRLSTKGRYAVTAMMDLAINDKKGPVTLSDISQCQGISLSYLEQLFAKLRRSGLVEGVRGPGGGYRLAVPPERVSVAQIITAVDEKVDTTLCAGRENCQEGERCLTHELWDSLSRQIFEFLDSITLAEFLSRPSVREVIQRQQSGQARESGKLTAA